MKEPPAATIDNWPVRFPEGGLRMIVTGTMGAVEATKILPPLSWKEANALFKFSASPL